MSAQSTTTPSLERMRYAPLSKSNRLVGLLNEIQDAIDAEDTAVGLWRISADLMACARAARSKGFNLQSKGNRIW